MKVIGRLVLIAILIVAVWAIFRFALPPATRLALASVPTGEPITVEKIVTREVEKRVEVPVPYTVTVETIWEVPVTVTVPYTVTPEVSLSAMVLATPTPLQIGVNAVTEDVFSAGVAYNEIYRPCPVGSFCLDLELAELHKCVGEKACVAATREKNLEAVIVPFYGANTTSCMQDGWMGSVEDRLKLGRKEPATALGSGVPAGYTGFLQGMTLRSCPPLSSRPTPTVTAPAVAATPKSLTKVEQVLVNVHIVGSETITWVECTPPEGSALCWSATGGGGVRMLLDCKMDGRGVGSDGKPYFPLNVGENNVIDITARPCSLYQAK